MILLHRLSWALACWALLITHLDAADTFTIASYNLEFYLDQDRGNQPAKPAASRAKIHESLRSVAADVLALQEVGNTNALLSIIRELRSQGLTYPYWEMVAGSDTNRHVAILSRFPITDRRPHPEENFLLHGRRFQVTRGFAEVDIRVTAHFSFTLLAVHLKSRRPIPSADETELREEEARRLREIIDRRLDANPYGNLVVAGDFNDTPDTRSTQMVIGRGAARLVDVRPAERNGDRAPNPNPRFAPRNIAWTYYYGKSDTYSRIDYLLLSRNMARQLDPSGTYVLAMADWGVASDHRPIVARFYAGN